MNTTTKTMFESMLRNGIGLDPHFFETTANQPNFPPHTISQQINGYEPTGSYRLTMAIAGYSEADITVTLKDDILTIEGQKPDADDAHDYRILYGGIAQRVFSRQFKIGDNVYVESAAMKNGLLQIDLMRHVPEAIKPKRIPINTQALEDRHSTK